jgi:hypothetical protein
MGRIARRLGALERRCMDEVLVAMTAGLALVGLVMVTPAARSARRRVAAAGICALLMLAAQALVQILPAPGEPLRAAECVGAGVVAAVALTGVLVLISQAWGSRPQRSNVQPSEF